jgi:hypothetical protein
MSAEKVIGYLAMKSRSQLVCDGEALIIAGSHAALKQLLAKSASDPVSSYRIAKAKFGEVVSGIERGGAYAFDAESYRRFSHLAREEGIPCRDYDFTPPSSDEMMLLTVTAVSLQTEGEPVTTANAGYGTHSFGGVRFPAPLT